MELQFNVSKKSSEEDEKREYDFIVIGAGAAGLSAAVYAVRSGMTALILDKQVAGGLTAESPLVENYLGFKAIPGTDLAREFINHASEYAKIKENVEVNSIRKEGDSIKIYTTDGEYTAKAAAITTGTSHKKLGIKGEEEYFGKGLSYCSTCDGYLFKNKDVVVIGGGNSGAIATIAMSEYTRKISIIEFMPKYMCEDAYTKAITKKEIPYIKNSQVTEVVGDGKKVTSVKYKDRETGKEDEIKTDGVFIYVGLVPQTTFLKGSGVELSDRGYIAIDEKGRTSVEGIYSAGDVTQGTLAQIATAVGDGCKIALTAYSDMVRAGKR